jgi:hypothetical protein
LVSLGQPKNPDLLTLAKSTQVSSKDRVITLTVHYPTSKVIAKLHDEVAKKSKKAKAAGQKGKGLKKQKTDPASEDEDVEPELEAEEEASKSGQ